MLAGLFPISSRTAESAITSCQPQQICISIIIDDLGDRWRDGQQAVELPGQITYGILPFTPYAQRLAEMAHTANKEIMLHLPMQAEAARPLGKGGLRQDMTQAEFDASVHASLQAVPFIAGINNHMGSLLTQQSRSMQWLMNDLAARPELYFIDSMTSANSQALATAQQYGIAAAARDVFLDNELDNDALQQQWQRFIQRARNKGSAIAIAHPHAATVAFLRTALPQLATEDVQLVNVSELLSVREQRRLAWHTSSSPWRKVVKNSKPLPSSTYYGAPVSP